MQILKYLIFLLIFLASIAIGKLLSKKYKDRLNELKEMKNAINIFKSKIKFTYAPLGEIFLEIANMSEENISKIFLKATDKMKTNSAGISWEEAVEETTNNLNKEDKQTIKMLSKLLGQTDIEGQLSQIEVTEGFLEKQIQDAVIEKEKNEKLYKKLIPTLGLVIIVFLM